MLGRLARCLYISAAILVALRPIGAAQQSPFVQALLDLTDAVEGIYGDEGARIAPALDRMSRALADRTAPPPAGVLSEVLGAAPFIPLGAYRDGYVRLARGEFDAAIADLRNAAARDPLIIDPGARSDAVQRAVAALKQGKLGEARSLLERSETLRDSSEARRVLGLVYWAESDFEKSREQIEAAIRLNARDERSRLALSRVLSSADRDADAARVLEETIRAVPDSGRAHWWLASAYERVNRFADARREYEDAAAAAVAGQSHLYGAIGRLASGAADLTGALDAFTRAVTASPSDPTWRRLRAGALLHLDRADAAATEYGTALRLAPRDAEAYAGLGQIHLNAGRYEEAVTALRRAAELRPDDVEAQYALAAALTRAGNDQEAARHFERVEAVQKQRLADRRRALSIDVLKEEAALRAAEHDYDRALGLWRQVIQEEPSRAANHLGLATALASAGQPDAAIEAYERAAALGAEPVVFRRLADLYGKAGRAPDAARAQVRYEMALRAGGRTAK